MPLEQTAPLTFGLVTHGFIKDTRKLQLKAYILITQKYFKRPRNAASIPQVMLPHRSIIHLIFKCFINMNRMDFVHSRYSSRKAMLFPSFHSCPILSPSLPLHPFLIRHNLLYIYRLNLPHIITLN